MKKIVQILILILLFSTKIWSQENKRIQNIKNNIEVLKTDIEGLNEKVDVDISNTSLSNFLLAVAKIHKININTGQQLNNIPIVNGFNDVIVGDLIVFLAKEYELDVDFTGNILSITKYQKPIEKEKPKEINATFNPMNNTLSLDLTNEKLNESFRRITDVSGKNLLFSPQLGSKELSAYMKDVPFDAAIEKLAISNNLEYEISDDGFYIFNEGVTNVGNNKNGATRIRPKRKKGNFFYEILNAEKKLISVDFDNTPIADIVYTLADELKLDVFITSPLENAGNATVKAEGINFDKLLIEIFESNATSVATSNNQNRRSNNRDNNNQQIQSSGSSSKFTFKIENGLYYFGTAEQLSVRKIEFVPLMHRSVTLLGDPSSTQNTSRYAGSFSANNQGSQAFFGNTSSVNSTSTNSINQNSTRNSNFNTNSFSNRSSSSSSSQSGDILSLFPNSVLDGLDVKLDVELNGFIVNGNSVRVEKFKEFIAYIDKPVPVILIEVMILEVERNSTIDAGVEFGLGEEAVTTQGVAFPDGNMTFGATTINRVIGGFDGFGSLNLGNVLPNFYANIRAMESNGILKILSTPKLSTLNGHKAYLSSGQTTYYEVTNQNFYGTQITQTSEITNYQPIDAELAIEFKPFVSGDGQVTLEIQVVQSSFGSRIDENAPPDINSRRFSSIIRMQNEDVAILGGIEEKFKSDSGSGVPLLSKIPILKWLFSQRSRTDVKSKLNILVKPTIFD